MVSSTFRWRHILWVLAGLACVPAAAAAQTPEPELGEARSYDRTSTTKAPHNKIDQRLRDEAAEFAHRRQRCDDGIVSACGELGEAYELGIGSAQNRPIASILYTEACDAGDAASCNRLGRVTSIAVEEDAKTVAFSAYRRACELGSLDGCANVARSYEAGAGVPQDSALAARLTRETCDLGGASACLDLAYAIMGEDPDRLRRDEFIPLLVTACDGGKVGGCEELIEQRRFNEPHPAMPPETETLRQACDLGDPYGCNRLGDIAFRGDNGSRDEVAAIRYYDRVCYLSPDSCYIAESIRAEPIESAACQNGDNSACARLAGIYSDRSLVLYDPDLARSYYEYACYAGAIEACASAGRAVLDNSDYLTSERAAQGIAYLEQGCAANDNSSCYQLAEHLKRGEIVVQDMPRYYSLSSRLCDEGWVRPCEVFEKNAEADLDVPLMEAGPRFLPAIEEGDTEWLEPYITEEEREDQRSVCADSTLEFRGKIYKDTVCRTTNRVIGGKALRPGAAPWQALIWRPDSVHGGDLSGRQRVLCGGSLIARGWILTAAHCLRDDDGWITRRGYQVRLGVYNPRADEGVAYPITRVYQHPDYKRSNYVFDIALIRYDPNAGQRSAVTNSIASIALDTVPVSERTIRQGQQVHVYGWGWTREVDSGSTAELRSARLELESLDRCTRITGYRGAALNAALCASGRNNEQACSGDSGGPLIAYSDRGPFVIGVVSSGRACGQAGEPSRFTRVALVRQWIEETINSNR